jgi:hypothetical protein
MALHLGGRLPHFGGWAAVARKFWLGKAKDMKDKDGTRKGSAIRRVRRILSNSF